MEKKTTEIKREIHTAGSVHVRALGEGEVSGRTIEGYAIRFDTPSAPLWQDEDEELREIIERGAVTQELLDSSDIRFTMFHDRQLLLARSKQGAGTLSYRIDEKGVWFSFEAPHTQDGDKALELVRSGIIDGCSFMFSTHYYDDAFVKRETRIENGRTVITCRVKTITGIHDMTITPDPAYPATEVEARELAHPQAEEGKPAPAKDLSGYIRAMREAAARRP